MLDIGSLAGRKVGPFNITRLLGHGGMGEVYEALDEVLDRQIALKVLRSNLSRDPAFVERFLREARAAARLNHPNIVQIYAVGDIAGLYYISMEYIRGATVAQFIERMGRLEVGQALRVTRHAAQAIAEAHQNGIVHRDIKPANLMVDQTGRVKVMDFGLAKHMETPQIISGDGITVGTPYYMAPEQVQGEQAGPRSDIYALGVTLYEMLAGRPPFVGESLSGLLQRVLNDPFPDVRDLRPDVPVDVARVIARMTAKRPEARYASAETVMADIHAAHEAFQKNTQVAGETFGLNPSPITPGSDSGQGVPDKRHSQKIQTPRKPSRWLITATVGNVALWIIFILFLHAPPPQNRTIEFMERGFPPIEALTEAARLRSEKGSRENREVEEQVWQRFLRDTTGTLEAPTFQPTEFLRAYAELLRATQIDPRPEALDLKLRFETLWKEYGFTLVRIDPATNTAVFQLEGSPTGIGETALKEGQTLQNRFLVINITAGSTALEDLSIHGRTLSVAVQNSLRGAQYPGNLQEVLRPTAGSVPDK